MYSTDSLIGGETICHCLTAIGGGISSRRLRGFADGVRTGFLLMVEMMRLHLPNTAKHTITVKHRKTVAMKTEDAFTQTFTLNPLLRLLLCYFAPICAIQQIALKL